MSFWSTERVALLRRLWIDGTSASQCAERIGGCSRNAVISKIHRLGLLGRAQDAGRGKPSGFARAASVRKIRKIRAANSNKPIATAAPSFNVPHIPIVPVEPHEPTYTEIDVPIGERKRLIDLERDDCRWPIGDPRDADFHFCNDKRVLGKSYCAHHVAVAYQPVRPAERRRSNVHVHHEHVEQKETVDA